MKTEYVIRRNSLRVDQYMNARGRWVGVGAAKTFRSMRAAVKFGLRYVQNFGVFPCTSN